MKKININIFLLIAFFLILLNQTNFFKNTFFVFSKNYDLRFKNAYDADYFSGFCEKESHGYIYYIKEEFNIEYPPKILNFEKKRRKLPYWIFYKKYNQINDDELILLNYKSEDKFNFEKYLILNKYNNRCFYLRKK